MKYLIVGSGPAGLSLAYILALNNKNVILIEQDKQLGGSWNSQWINGKYWSENSPRVFSYTGNTKKLFLNLGFKDEDYVNIYGNLFETNYKVFSFILKNFELLDYFIFLLATIKYMFVVENITILHWMKNSNLSNNAKKAISILCILINDKPENTNINDFFASFSLLLPKHMREPDKWSQIIENYLLTKNNVKIYKYTKVIKLISNYNKNLADGAMIVNLFNNKTSIVHCDKIILCTQSNGLYPILNNSSNYIKNNWMPIKKMKEWSQNTFYSGFGFQLHFDKEVTFKDEWCWSCNSDWSIIILPVSKWLKKFSKDSKIKTVWSCCIVDLDTKSSRLNKNANECDLDEVVKECIDQIKKNYNIPNPYGFTTSLGLKKINNKWISKNTGYTKSTYNDLEMKGINIENLFALGCFTKNIKNHIAYIGGSIDAVQQYLEQYEQHLDINIFN